MHPDFLFSKNTYATERTRADEIRPGDMIIDTIDCEPLNRIETIVFIVSIKRTSKFSVSFTTIIKNKISTYHYYNEDFVVKSVYR